MMSLLLLRYLCLCLPVFSGINIEQFGFPILKGAYLGQEPPGVIPEIFAPGVVSTDADEGCSSFSADGQWYLFARARAALDGILYTQQVDSVWTEPDRASFSVGEYDWDFSVAPDGRTVYVSSCRPLREGGLPEREYRIWISERTADGWSDPRLLSFPVNSGQHDSHPFVTRDGTLYFFSNRSGGFGQGDIYYARCYLGQYPDVKNIGAPINTEHHEADPFISPDEDYLVFCSDKPGGFGNTDLYITFREMDGSWMEPVNMGGSINSPFAEYIPYTTPDGRYFFFTSDKSGNREIYWVDAGIVELLRTTVCK